jgi:hypothetical protein
MSWVFHLCERYFGDFVKYDIVGGRREKGCGEEGEKRVMYQSLLGVIISRRCTN